MQELGLGKLETSNSAGNNIKVHYFVKQPVPEIDSEVTEFASKIATVGIHLEGFKCAYNSQDVESQNHYEDYVSRPRKAVSLHLKQRGWLIIHSKKAQLHFMCCF